MSPKTIVITGASRGLGAGMAIWFAQQDHQLGLCARGAPVLRNSDTVHTQSFSVSDFESFESFTHEVEKNLGPIDLWINNAGVLGPIGPLRDLPPQQIHTHMTTNVVGLAYGSQLYVQHLHRMNHRGVLINISSGAARGGYHGWTSYCASKAAVDNFTRALALEEEDRLRAYSVAPGVIDTAMQEQVRSCTKEQFPMVDKFHALKANDDFNSPAFVAQELLNLAFGTEQTTEILLRLPNENH